MRKLLCGGLMLASLVLASTASAATVQLGELAAANTVPGDCGNCASFQTGTGAGIPSYAVPAGDGGVITTWSVLGAPLSNPCSMAGCNINLLVYRPTGTAGTYDLVGESIVEDPVNNGAAQSFATHIVVHPGDVIGLFYNDTPAFDTAVTGDVITSANGGTGNGCAPTFTVGAPCDTSSTSPGNRLSVTATVQTPAASFTPSTSSPTEGTAVNFNASSSTSAGTITDYSWNFGDGTTLDSGATATASHTYTATGAHTVTLTITDSNSDTATSSTGVTVSAPPAPIVPPAPVAPPAPEPPTFLGSTPASTTLTATSSGKITLNVACSSTAVTSCQDTVDLYSATGTLPTTASAHHVKKGTLLGRVTFTVTSGATATEILALNSAGRKLLKKNKHFSARALITATDGADRTVTQTTSVTVKHAAKRPHQASLSAWLRQLALTV
jgi:PKD repeat protein